MIIAPDLHLRTSVPRCRTETEEEWYKVQKDTLEFLYSFNEPVYFVGDIFHDYAPGNKMVHLFLSYALQHDTYIMMGNHDARKGILDPDSGYGILHEICMKGDSHLKHIDYDYVPFGEEEVHKVGERRTYLFMHQLVVQSNSDTFPGKNCITARALLDKYPDYRYIIVGDNHQHFLFESKGRYVLNAGCMTKQSVEYKDRVLKCFRLYKGEIEALELPDKGELIDDAYIVAEHERDDRYIQLVESLKINEEMSFDFRSNIASALIDNHLGNGTEALVKEWVGI